MRISTKSEIITSKQIPMTKILNSKQNPFGTWKIRILNLFSISDLRFRISRQGFTLVELLVVTAIISLLGSAIFVQVAQVRSKARDAQRERDIKTLQDSLAIYVVNNRTYPASDPAIALTGSDPVSQELINKESIPKIPLDPFNYNNYRYVYASVDGSTYLLTYYLETNTISGKSIGVQTASP